MSEIETQVKQIVVDHLGIEETKVTPESKFNNARARSRHAAIRISNTGSRYGWRTGDLRLEVRPDGKR